jgi:hypothetical protein
MKMVFFVVMGCTGKLSLDRIILPGVAKPASESSGSSRTASGACDCKGRRFCGWLRLLFGIGMNRRAGNFISAFANMDTHEAFGFTVEDGAVYFAQQLLKRVHRARPARDTG